MYDDGDNNNIGIPKDNVMGQSPKNLEGVKVLDHLDIPFTFSPRSSRLGDRHFFLESTSQVSFS